MDGNMDVIQQANLNMVKRYPYIAYLLNATSVGDSAINIIDDIPDNYLDYMMIDLESNRMCAFGIEYNDSGYYELSIGFLDYTIDYKFTYTFKISEKLMYVINDCMETMFGEPVQLNDITPSKPKLTLIKGGKDK